MASVTGGPGSFPDSIRDYILYLGIGRVSFPMVSLADTLTFC